MNMLAVRQMPRAHLNQRLSHPSPPEGQRRENLGRYTFGNTMGMAVGQAFHAIVDHGPSRLILEDLIGFGGLRTFFDLSRNRIYGTHGSHGSNKSLARERIFREVGNLIATNFLGGLLMYGFASIARNSHMGQQFIKLETLDYFDKLIAPLKGDNGNPPPQEPFRTRFIRQLAQDMAPPQSEVTDVERSITQLFHSLDPKQRQTQFQSLSTELKRELGADHTLARVLDKYDHDPNKALRKVAKKMDYFINHDQWGQKNPALLTQYKKLRAQFQSSSQLIDNVAETLIRRINPDAQSFDLPLHLKNIAKDAPEKLIEEVTHTFKINDLLEDAYQYTQSAEASIKGGKNALNSAQDLLKRTKRLNTWGMPLAFGASIVFTVVVPLLNKILTRKVDKIRTYPGEIGLREMEAVNSGEKGWFEKYMPYITNNLKNGNPMPLLLSFLPLPFAVGMVDNKALIGGKWDFKWPWAKGFGKRCARMFQFRKVFPFVPIQQITALCALVSSARIWTARDRIEARERYVDSYGGWVAWIALIPNAKNWVKKQLDKHGRLGWIKTGKTDFGKRDVGEILRFTTDSDTLKNTMKYNKRLESYIFLPIMLFTMGILEPVIALKWTEAQVKRIFGSLQDKKWLAVGQRLHRKATHAAQTPLHPAPPNSLTPPPLQVLRPKAKSTLRLHQSQQRA